MRKKPLDTVKWEAFSSKKKRLQMSFLWKNYITVLFIYVIDNCYLRLSKWKINYDTP